MPTDEDVQRVFEEVEARQAEDLTDGGNANVFVRLMGDRVRHVGAWETWMVYDGRRWERDENHLVETLMRQALLTRFDEAKAAADEDAKAIGRWAVNSRATARVTAALVAARSDQRITASPEDFDRDPRHFNCLNGTLNLSTGKVHRHDPRDLLTKIAPVEYDRAARSPLWDRVLDEATDGDQALQTTLQRLAGYCLTGDTSEEKFFMLYGPEATIKSTFTEALSATWGDYAQAAESDTFLSRDHVGGPRNDVAGLEGRRVCVVAEFDRDRKMAEALLKQLTGGDRVRARRLYHEAREFAPTFKLLFHTNHVPTMSDDDGAVWRRAWIIPFDHQIPEDQRDPAVKAELKNPAVSGAAILAWAVRGCLEWQQDGLGKPPAIARATQAVRVSMDPLAGFLGDCAAPEPGVWTASAMLRSAYDQWAKAHKATPISSREWGTRLSSRGFKSVKRNGVRGWEGVRLMDAEYVESTLLEEAGR